MVKLISSTTDPEKIPPLGEGIGVPEIALIGRSNVGKSSIVNLLTKYAAGASVASRAGTTREINHYRIDNKWVLVDLPGYGFAKDVSDEEKFKWDNFTKSYFLTRKNLASVFLLVDSHVPHKQSDFDYADWMLEHNVPFTIVFTK